MYEYKGTVQDVLRNGSVIIQVDLGFDVIQHVQFRLANLRMEEPVSDAVELIAEECPPGTVVIVNSIRDQDGEYLATLYVEGQAMNINDLLVSEGAADTIEVVRGKK